ncbi:MAG: type II CAAX prenyl endopeptidase Rce1 family protein [bacterium]
MWPIFRSDYWQLSRHPVLNVLFVTPLWVLYEFLAYRLNHGWVGSIRTGTDFLIKKCFSDVGLNAGLAVFIPVILICSFIVFQVKIIRKLQRKTLLFAFMFCESLSYALIFGIMVGGVTKFFLTQESVGFNYSRISALVINIGSGVYEEFFFRFLFITGFVALFKKYFHVNRYIIYTSVIVLSSLLFAFFHYLNYFNEPLRWDSFYFRFFAGVAFAILFLMRGYGITAYTHSLYNILLMFRYN